jgi:hypothetical protein
MKITNASDPRHRQLMSAWKTYRAFPAWAVAFMIAVSPLAACRRSGPPVQMVQGVVTLDGKPIDGVAVTFTPAAGEQGIQAFGTTQADGSYTLSAFRGARPGSGTVIGDYLVSCTKTIGGDLPLEVPPPPDDATAADHEAWRREEAKRRRTPPTPIQYLVPKAYGDSQTSGLRATVKKGLNSGPEFQFDLRSDFKGNEVKR